MRKNKLKLVIVIISIIIASILLINFINRQSKIAKCQNTYLYELPLYFDKYTYDEIINADVYVIEKKSRAIIDSTNIEFLTSKDSTYPSPRYKFKKAIGTAFDWKIKLSKEYDKTSDFIIISDINTKYVEENNMFGKNGSCRIYQWKVNGIQYSIDNGDKFIQAK